MGAVGKLSLYLSLRGRYEDDVRVAREDGSTRYYRFTLPAEVDGAEAKLPAEIELFSKAPWPVDEGVEVVPMPFDGDLSSLSAILLDENYFEFIREGIVGVHGVPVPDVLHIIPLKMRAHMDLSKRHDAGEHVRRKTSRSIAQTS